MTEWIHVEGPIMFTYAYDERRSRLILDVYETWFEPTGDVTDEFLKEIWKLD